MTPGSDATREMFARVSPRYDRLNRLLSLGHDRRWRRRLARALRLDGVRSVLDVACGTGDVAIELARHMPAGGVVGVDFCRPMLELCAEKVASTSWAPVALVLGDALSLPFAGGRFDRVSIAFGIRNVADVDRCLAELYGVLSPGGTAAILEFSRPTGRIVRALYLTYFLYLLPLIGRLVSGVPEAYSYLPASVLAFPDRKEFCARVEAAGFGDVRFEDLTFGIATLYLARRPGP